MGVKITKMKIIKGDLIKLAKQGTFDLIAHGSNCFCKMGAGIAKDIRIAFPEAWLADKKTVPGDKKKLGTITWAQCGDVIVVNAYTQFDYWTKDKVLVEYDALRSCFETIKVQFSGKRIGIPKIGAGLARGDWNRIAAIIDEVMVGEDVTLVEYQP
jgi:O-acetyl-ADP-ribose deacetylase (regulator of RNase III)